MTFSTALQENSCNLTLLESILENQISLCDRIATVFRLKQKMLLDWQTDELESTVELEEKLLGEMERLEGSRRDAVGEIADALQMDGEATFSDIASAIELSKDHELVRLSEILREKANELADLNTSNAYLARNIIEYSTLILKLFTHESQKSSYNSRGSMQSEGIRRSIVNTKV